MSIQIKFVFYDISFFTVPNHALPCRELRFHYSRVEDSSMVEKKQSEGALFVV